MLKTRTTSEIGKLKEIGGDFTRERIEKHLREGAWVAETTIDSERHAVLITPKVRQQRAEILKMMGQFRAEIEAFSLGWTIGNLTVVEELVLPDRDRIFRPSYGDEGEPAHAAEYSIVMQLFKRFQEDDTVNNYDAIIGAGISQRTEAYKQRVVETARKKKLFVAGHEHTHPLYKDEYDRYFSLSEAMDDGHTAKSIRMLSADATGLHEDDAIAIRNVLAGMVKTANLATPPEHYHIGISAPGSNADYMVPHVSPTSFFGPMVIHKGKDAARVVHEMLG